MSDVKAGDTVVCVNPYISFNKFRHGQEYLVYAVKDSFGTPQVVISGVEGWWDASRFRKKVEEPKPTIRRIVGKRLETVEPVYSKVTSPWESEKTRRAIWWVKAPQDVLDKGYSEVTEDEALEFAGRVWPDKALRWVTTYEEDEYL